MDFDLTDVHASWKSRGEALGREVAGGAAAARVVLGAARLGLIDAGGDLLGLAVAVEAMAGESPAAWVAVALHSAAALAVTGEDRFSPLFRGEAVAATDLSSDDLPVARRGRLSWRAAWVAPITDGGVAFVGARSGDEHAAFAVALDAPGVTVERVDTAALIGVACAYVSFDSAACTRIGTTLPVRTRIRILVVAAGLGMGRRALQEALATARASQADAGEGIWYRGCCRCSDRARRLHADDVEGNPDGERGRRVTSAVPRRCLAGEARWRPAPHSGRWSGRHKLCR